ncbi:MAG: c-type cytochrome [Gemmatimonadota bacterium]
MRISKLLLSLAPSMVLVACSSGSPPATGTGTTAPPSVDARSADAPASSTAVPAQQAQRGENAFLASCTACHSSGEFNDTAFQTRWRNRTARDLFELMAATMPEDAPNSLPRERYVEIVAYLLTLNGFPTSGTGSGWDVGALGDVGLGTLGSR